MGNGAIGIGIPEWQASSSHEPENMYANDETRRNLKAKLLSSEYEMHITEAGEYNREIKDAFIKTVGSKRTRGGANISEASEDKSYGINNRRLAAETVIGMATRLRNKDIYNFFTVVLSLLFLFYAVPGVIWGVLQDMRLIHSRTWAETLAIELGKDVSTWDGRNCSVVAIVVFDNKAYFAKTKYQHVPANDEGGPRIRTDGEYLHTVNRLHVPITEDVESHARGSLSLIDWKILTSLCQKKIHDFLIGFC